MRCITERAIGTERLDLVVFGSLSRVILPRTSTAVCVTWIRLRSTLTSRRRRPTASPHRSPAYAPTKINATYSAGISDARRSTSAWDR